MTPLATPDNLIFQIRQKLEMNQEQFAEALGCSLMTARRLEYGTAPKSKAVQFNLKKLARKAGVDLEKKPENSS